MFRFAVKLALAAGALWAVWTWVPVGGRTLASRWKAAGSLAGFLDQGWAEARAALATPPAPAKPDAPSRPGTASRERPERPTESHTEEDRRDLDRIVAERLTGG